LILYGNKRKAQLLYIIAAAGARKIFGLRACLTIDVFSGLWYATMRSVIFLENEKKSKSGRAHGALRRAFD
jgi:hypothetical protein